jgi:methyl-accepting chemotaxis protein
MDGEEGDHMGKPPHRRRKLIIDPNFQVRASVAIFLFVLVYSGLLALLIFYPLKVELDKITDDYARAVIADQILVLHARVWPAVLAVALLAGGQIIFFSHRIAGPIYRVRMTLGSLLKGDYGVRIKLRDRDHFKELEPMVNQLAELLEAQSAKIEQLTSLVSSDGANLSEIRTKVGELASHTRGEGRTKS